MTQEHDEPRRDISRDPVEMWVEIDPPGGSLTAHVASDPADMYSPTAGSEAERCWRCDARDATTDVGLCDPCHASLTAR